ncbi:MAG TPA: M15 family metallopeptidase [Rhizomicrobium sp.]|nr:M15 family metallopeptidase [Rhizomicrobium sp.]
MSNFDSLDGLRATPIPDQAEARRRKEGFRAYAIDKTSAAAGENLVNLSDHGIAAENYYYSTRNPPYWRRIEGAIPDVLARRAVALKLAGVNTVLHEADIELFVFDGWRPRAVQTYFHDVWMPQEIRKRNPSISDDELERAVETYWAAPSANADSPAPHATGGAVDLTLRFIGGERLWMGSIFDDVTALAHRDHFESNGTKAMAFSDEEARANRRLLHWIMTDAGFVGHPDEWWHFSYGDQLWAKLSGAPAALYGEASPYKT